MADCYVVSVGVVVGAFNYGSVVDRINIGSVGCGNVYTLVELLLSGDRVNTPSEIA